jgi:purine-binding chemotaxis protein CheW
MSGRSVCAASELRAEMGRLQQRVQQLRSELDRLDGVKDDELEVLTGVAGEQTVAVPLVCVEQVLLVPALLPLPDAPPWQPGILRLRGVAMPVIDVLARFQSSARDIVGSDVVVVVRAGDDRFGLLFQDVSGVWRVARRDRQMPGEPGHLAPYVIGLIPVQDRVGLLLSVHALVATPEEG